MLKVNRPENEAAFTSSTPMASAGIKIFPDVDLPAVLLPKKRHRPIIDVIIDAVKEVGVGRKGASYQAIKKFFQNERQSQDPKLSKYLISALKKGIEDGVLKKSSASTNSRGAIGSYVLLKPPKGKKKQPAKEKKLAEKAEVGVKKPKKTIGVVSVREVTGKSKPMKNKLKSVIEQRVLAKLSGSRDRGATASYLERKKQPPKGKKLAEKAKINVKKPKKTIGAVSDSEVTGTKPMEIRKKLNLSDRTSSELEQITAPEEKHQTAPEKHKQKENLHLKQKPKPKIQTEESSKAKSGVVDLKKQKVTKDTAKPEKKRIPRIIKDLSDSEMVVKKPSRKSMKSYSSDTEVNNIAAKPKKNAPKQIGAKVTKKPQK